MFVTLMLLAMPGIGGHNPALGASTGQKIAVARLFVRQFSCDLVLPAARATAGAGASWEQRKAGQRLPCERSSPPYTYIITEKIVVHRLRLRCLLDRAEASLLSGTLKFCCKQKAAGGYLGCI
jgi:hypothetical protein